jgi:predicted phage terminase large subunit-like protein
MSPLRAAWVTSGAYMTDLIKKTVDEWLNDTDYSEDYDYVPSEFALEFVSFIKLVNGEEGEENLTPVIHYRMLDNIVGKKQNIANMCSRGLAKTTIFAEYLFLYIAVYGGIPGFGDVDYALYVSDSIENGVKKMRLRMERRCENSPFLIKYLTKARFTDIRWHFKNASGKEFVVTGHGAKTGVRGTVELNTRPQLAILDDLIGDEDAKSPTIIENVENTVYKAIDYALHPNKRKTIWSGTPFNARDPLYKAIESGAWHVNVYPVCEAFPCTREEFRGAWDDRFNYDYVKNQYTKAKLAGKTDAFNQELMLRIMSPEERLIDDVDIIYYKHSTVMRNKGAYNFYITTDFATSDKEHADFSVINVWALNNNGDWLWVDGFCKRVLMDESIDNLFRLVQIYNPQEVGIEVTGQQGGFIAWIQNEMGNRNNYFTLSKGQGSGNTIGIRPTKDKMSRFQQNAVPLFKAKKIWLPEELKESPQLTELISELSLATFKGFKSKHDDQIDTISMLAELNAWKPSEVGPMEEEEDESFGSDMWSDETKQVGGSSYFV